MISKATADRVGAAGFPQTRNDIRRFSDLERSSTPLAHAIRDWRTIREGSSCGKPAFRPQIRRCRTRLRCARMKRASPLKPLHRKKRSQRCGPGCRLNERRRPRARPHCVFWLTLGDHRASEPSQTVEAWSTRSYPPNCAIFWMKSQKAERTRPWPMAQGSICESKREPVFTPHAGVQPPKLTGSCKIEDAQAPSAVRNGIRPDDLRQCACWSGIRGAADALRAMTGPGSFPRAGRSLVRPLIGQSDGGGHS
jgi:hypothetical protein